MDTAMLTTRNATLEDLAAILQTQKAEQLDIVAPAATLRSKGGVLHIEGVGEPTISESGVTPGVGTFRPTGVFDEGLADKLQIPVAFLRRMREQRPDLYDLNINGLLHGKSVRKAGGDVEVIHPADDRKFLLRLFRGDERRRGRGPRDAVGLLQDDRQPGHPHRDPVRGPGMPACRSRSTRPT